VQRQHKEALLTLEKESDALRQTVAELREQMASVAVSQQVSYDYVLCVAFVKCSRVER
jgi:predicted dithiol-disulfide oxidoreductase (DUF899 family)